MDQTRQDLIGPNQIGLDQPKQNRTGPNQARLNWTRLKQTSQTRVGLTWLGQIKLDGLDRTGTKKNLDSFSYIYIILSLNQVSFHNILMDIDGIFRRPKEKETTFFLRNRKKKETKSSNCSLTKIVGDKVVLQNLKST